MTSAGGNTLILTRRYTPTWAIVLAIVGLLLFFVGLLLLLVKETETVTIALTETEVGTRVSISGVATQSMVARLNTVLLAMPQVTA